MDAPILTYQSAPSGEPSPRQHAAAHALCFWAIMLIVLGLLLAVTLVDRVLIERTGTSVPVVRGPRGTLLELRYTYSIAWKHLPYIAPLILCPAALAGAYLALARRLQRRAADRTTLMVIMLLTMLHTLAAAACVLLFIFVGGAVATLGQFTWRSLLDFILCLIAVAMVPGMFWACIRFMDLLQSRPLTHHPAPASPPPAVSRGTE